MPEMGLRLFLRGSSNGFRQARLVCGIPDILVNRISITMVVAGIATPKTPGEMLLVNGCLSRDLTVKAGGYATSIPGRQDVLTISLTLQGLCSSIPRMLGRLTRAVM